MLIEVFCKYYHFIPRGIREDEAKSNDHFQKFALHKNMKIQLRDDIYTWDFTELILKIWDGNYLILDDPFRFGCGSYFCQKVNF